MSARRIFRKIFRFGSHFLRIIGTLWMFVASFAAIIHLQPLPWSDAYMLHLAGYMLGISLPAWVLFYLAKDFFRWEVQLWLTGPEDEKL